MIFHHTITTEIAGKEVEIEIDFTKSRYIPAVLWGDSACPAEGGEIEIRDMTIIISPGRFPCPPWLFDIIAEDDGLIDALSDSVTDEDEGPDPDAAYERARDERAES